MDARVLWSGHSLQATRYALQYTMKRQNVLDNVAVVRLAFEKRVDRERDLESTEYGRGIGRLLSLAYATCGVMEIGGPLATAILMEGEAVTFSCMFERLVLLEGLNILNEEEVEAMVVVRGDGLYTDTSIQKYVQRPRCLEKYCWYDYCRWFKQTSPDVSTIRRPCSFSSTSKSELRVHLRKHNVRYYEYPNVPNIVGPRLSDATRLGDEDYEEQTELFYRMALLLYHPFRKLDTFLDRLGSAKTKFTTWAPFCDPEIARALDYHQQYYIGLRMAQQYREQLREEGDDDSSEDAMLDDDDVIHYQARCSPNESQHHHTYTVIPPESYCTADDIDVDDHHTSKSIVEAQTPQQELLWHAIVSSPLPPDHTATFVACEDTITRAQIINFLRQQSLPQDGVTKGKMGHRPPQHQNVEVERYEIAIQDTAHSDCALPSRPSIHAVSQHFSLNASQHIAFTLIAAPLLAKISGVPIASDRVAVFSTSPLIITGAGGTGKSQIIAAIRALLAGWNRADAVRVVASTGIAAASLNGCTMHSSVGLGINTFRLPKHIEAPSDDLVRQWSPVLCVIADEVSMVDLVFFGLWEEALRHVKDNLDEQFGGMLGVLMFDHCQLRPVKGAAMYKTANPKSPLSTLQDRGRHLYRSIEKVIYLNENMRFSQDVEWGSWLASARLGNWVPSIREFITSMPDEDALAARRPIGMVQTISTDNATRTAINETAIRTAVEALKQNRKVYVIPARLSRQLSPSDLAFIKALPDNKTGNIPVFLHLYIGMPVRIKANQCVPNGVVNGATGIVYHIDWAPNTDFNQQSNSTWLASTQPTNVYIQLTKCANHRRFPSLPQDWPSTMMPVHEITASVSIAGYSVSIKGFPLVPAFGTTVHGVQGETRRAIAVTNLRPPNCPRVDSHALYVALSRITTRHGLYWFGDRPTLADYDYFRPAADVLIEDARLRPLSDKTMEKFRQLARSNELA